MAFMTIQQWENDLLQWIPSNNIKTNETLKKYTMTKLGGKADILVLPETEEQAAAVVKYAYENNVPLLMLGMAPIWSYVMAVSVESSCILLY